MASNDLSDAARRPAPRVSARPTVEQPEAEGAALAGAAYESPQRTIGNLRLATAAPNAAATQPRDAGTIQRFVARAQTIAVGSAPAHVIQRDEEENKQKKAISDAVKNAYGIDFDSEAGAQAARDFYISQLPPAKRTGAKVPKLKPRDWTLEELRMAKTVLDRYGPILSKQKTDSKQVIKTLSRLKAGLDENGKKIKIDPDTFGETFDQEVNGTKQSNVSMYDSAATDVDDFGGGDKGWRGTLSHEFSHALIEKLPAPSGAGNDTANNPITTMLGYWVKQTGYWDDEDTERGNRTEDPVTSYGKDNAAEDMAEAMMYFFEDPAKLRTDCPIRFKFIVDHVSPSLNAQALKEVEIALGGTKASPKVAWPGTVNIPW
jgi:hypothetical protein